MRLAITIATAAVLAVPSLATAALTGEVSINGEDNFDSSSVHFIGNGNVQGTAGSFDVLPNCAACVAFSINPLTPSSTGLLWTITDAGHTSTYTISSIDSFVSGGTVTLPDLTVNSTGTLALDGVTSTGVMELTTQGPTGTVNVTFSATAVPTPAAIPEPASLALLGAGILGLGLTRWRLH